jgi:hypothetical protein
MWDSKPGRLPPGYEPGHLVIAAILLVTLVCLLIAGAMADPRPAGGPGPDGQLSDSPPGSAEAS